MKIILILLFLNLNIYSQNLYLPPIKIGHDKILHFSASYAISHTTYYYFQPRIGKKKAKRYSIIASLGIGILKEIIDEHYRKGWESKDMYSNIGGILLFRFDLEKL